MSLSQDVQDVRSTLKHIPELVDEAYLSNLRSKLGAVQTALEILEALVLAGAISMDPVEDGWRVNVDAVLSDRSELLYFLAGGFDG